MLAGLCWRLPATKSETTRKIGTYFPISVLAMIAKQAAMPIRPLPSNELPSVHSIVSDVADDLLHLEGGFQG